MNTTGRLLLDTGGYRVMEMWKEGMMWIPLAACFWLLAVNQLLKCGKKEWANG